MTCSPTCRFSGLPTINGVESTAGVRLKRDRSPAEVVDRSHSSAAGVCLFKLNRTDPILAYDCLGRLDRPTSARLASPWYFSPSFLDPSTELLHGVGQMDRKQYWERVYETKAATEVGWFQVEPALSLRMLDAAGLTGSS